MLLEGTSEGEAGSLGRWNRTRRVLGSRRAWLCTGQLQGQEGRRDEWVWTWAGCIVSRKAERAFHIQLWQFFHFL